jgi:hypothetical protein
MRASMTPHRLAPRPDDLSHPPARSAAPACAVGWTRKTFALTMHAACLALFWLLVVRPVVTPIASGELQREFAPVLRAWTAWTSELAREHRHWLRGISS